MKKFLVILLGILVIIGGVWVLFHPAITAMSLGLLFACILFVNGILNIVMYFKKKQYLEISGWYLVSAILSVIAGALIMADGRLIIATSAIILYVVAFWFIITGIIRIVLSFKMKKRENSNWWVFLLLGILLILAGIFSFANPSILGLTLGIILGINMMVCGVDVISLALVVDPKE